MSTNREKYEEISNPNLPEANYFSWDKDGGYAVAADKYSNAIDGCDKFARASNYRSFVNIDTNVSVRSEFDSLDFEFFRPNAHTPHSLKKAIEFSMAAYEKNGIIKNIIDLMGDFGSQGIQIVHSKPRLQDFYRAWFRKVNGVERSERFLNTLYRAGNVVVRKYTAKLKDSDITKLRKTAGKVDVRLEPEPNVGKLELPVKYIMLTPLSVDVVAEELSVFAGRKLFGMKISSHFSTQVKKALKSKNPDEVDILKDIPQDIIDAIVAGKRIINVPPDKISSYSYKKDDWCIWGLPMVYCVLRDILSLERMKLADMAALDGIISSVRLWTLGSLEHQVAPTKTGLSKLSSILRNNVGGGTFDMVWGPELSFKESSSDAYKFLGQDKYIPILNAIFGGLGIPQTLRESAGGSGSSGGGAANNYMSLKTLIERLQYGRNLLASFWQSELVAVQKAMGHREAAQIRFDRMTLSDENAEKALLIQLADRDLISTESLLERFNELPKLEKIRVNRENKSRDKEKMAKKASPWHNPQVTEDLLKIFAQRGVITPSEADVPLEPKKPGEMTQHESMMKLAKVKTKDAGPLATDVAKNPGVPQQGRPKNSKDKQKRKKKKMTFRTRADEIAMMTWAKNALASVNEILLPGILHSFGKQNLRQLTNSEALASEEIKFATLLQLKPLQQIDSDIILDILRRNGGAISTGVLNTYKKMINHFETITEGAASLDDQRNIQVLLYSLSNGVADPIS